MGLDEFRTSKTNNYTKTAESTDKINKASKELNKIEWSDGSNKTINNTDQAIRAIYRFYSVFGRFPNERREFDRLKDEINISTPSKHFKQNCGITYNEVMRKCTGSEENINRGSSDAYDEWEIYYYILKSVKEYGEDISGKQFDSDNKYPNANTVKNVTGKTWAEAKDYLSIELNRKKWSKSEVVSEIEKNFTPSETITHDKISSRCEFEHPTVSKFGGGELSKAIKSLNLSNNYNANNQSSYYSKVNAEDIIKEQDYDRDSDGYVYILKLDSKNSKYLYVGKVQYGQPLRSRINNHITRGGQFTKYIREDNEFKKKNSNEFFDEIKSIVEINEFYKDSEQTESNFNNVTLSSAERIIFKEAVKNYNKRVEGGN